MGTTGLFQQITVAQWNDKEGEFFNAPAANGVEVVGLTCDNPVALGYKSAGYNVAWVRATNVCGPVGFPPR